jgi:hypothetical protein
MDGNSAMRCRKTRFGRFLRRQSASALLCAAGLGAVGCAGGHLDLSSRWNGVGDRSGAERSAAAAAQHREESEATSRIERTGLSRVLTFQRDGETAGDSREQSAGGRVFSAFVNRLPGRRQPAGDPFLDKQSVAATPPATASDPRTPVAGVARTKPPTREVAARTATPAPQHERSDAELWQMFNTDVAGTATVRATPRNTAPARNAAPVAAAPARTPSPADSLPAWAQPQPAQSPATSNARSLPPLVAQAQAPRSQQERVARTRINPSSKPQTVPRAPATTRREADLQLEQLLAEAHRLQETGDLFEAYRVAVIAEELAEREHIVFAPRQPRPADIVRDIEQRMRESLSPAEEAPAVATAPAMSAQHAPSGPVAVATPRAAAVAVSARRTGDPFADTASPRPQAALRETAARPTAKASTPGARFDSEFPALHEWRGVRANSPVSLTASNVTTGTIDDSPDHPVQQAFATDEPAAASNRAPLLARAEAERDQILAAGQGTSLFSGRLRSPVPIPAHPELKAVAVPPPPTLADSPARPAIAAAAGRSSGGGLVWWVLGGMLALTGAVAVRSRRQAGRR